MLRGNQSTLFHIHNVDVLDDNRSAERTGGARRGCLDQAGFLRRLRAPKLFQHHGIPATRDHTQASQVACDQVHFVIEPRKLGLKSEIADRIEIESLFALGRGDSLLQLFAHAYRATRVDGQFPARSPSGGSHQCLQ
jgi:hypothetical protein